MSGYPHTDSSPPQAHGYLVPAVLRNLSSLHLPNHKRRILDLGCGNGSAAAVFRKAGFEVVGVDPSAAGIAQARAAHPHIQFHRASAYDDLVSRYGRFPVVVSLEVVEHLYFPHVFAQRVYDLLEDGGFAIISTPYHGYLKNLAIALAGRMDRHYTALTAHGHIKFWSRRTMGRLLEEAGFQRVRFELVGRIPPVAKSMIAVVGRLPGANASGSA